MRQAISKMGSSVKLGVKCSAVRRGQEDEQDRNRQIGGYRRENETGQIGGLKGSLIGFRMEAAEGAGIGRGSGCGWPADLAGKA
ncbi:hypothetical protein HPP92_006736 [Vanilla planifolia]|uniref:Uncharacterized protein n=1 Tax=Vanilla planifolia TaxID=51239 RepID=A0A835RPF8_VANPL|nr:hypothetical protein HPP92_006736 [Vanilla planifolia]